MSSYNALTPRFWHGMLLGPWLRMLVRNRFHFSPSRVPTALAVTGFAVLNSVSSLLQNVLYSGRLARVEIDRPPIFILGHWRSGTTLLHELLVRDPRHTFPTTYQCFAPSHFLLTGWIVPRLFSFVLPAQRPMDNMEAGWDCPQEDEFALCNLGIPSPYLTMAFPNREPAYPEYLDLSGLAPGEMDAWKRALTGFLHQVTYRDPRRIVLKSPPHTARLRTLLDIYPDARFVHIVRHPFALFPSTMKLWKSLHDVQGLHVPDHEGLEEYVFDGLERMYEAFERDRALVAPNQLYEVRYEDLIVDPLAKMSELYAHLDLGDFETARPAMAAYLRRVDGYQTNRHQLSPELERKIRQRWGSYLERYGYAESAMSVPS